MWSQVIKMLKDSGRLGFSLPLRCFYHPDTPIEVITPEDFLRKAPEGGCSEQCDQELECGHPCTFKCHSKERHESVVCQTPCERVHPKCGHTCTLHCGLECGKCMAPVTLELKCGHTVSNVACHESRLIAASIKCDTLVEQKVPGCGHAVMMRCGKTTLDPHFICKAECGALLLCGHQCFNPCNMCRAIMKDEVSHGHCKTRCGRPYSECSHECEAVCHAEDACPACESPCEARYVLLLRSAIDAFLCSVTVSTTCFDGENRHTDNETYRCSHSVCSKRCNEACSPCAEPCNAGCEHQGFCTMPCAVPCNVLPCSRRCDKSLACGHQCPCNCGEPCPEWGYCQVCANPTIKQTIANYTEGLKYEEIDLENNPLIVPSCGHIMDTVSMDTYMAASSSPDVIRHLVLALPSDPRPLSVENVNQCFTCRGSLQDINRYNRISKRSSLDANTIKFDKCTSEHLIPLASALQLEQKTLLQSKMHLSEEKIGNLDQFAVRGSSFAHPFLPTRVRIGGPRGVQLHNISEMSGLKSRLGPMLALRDAVNKVSDQVKQDERVFEQVHHLSQKSLLTDGGIGEPTPIQQVFVLQAPAYLYNQLLLLLCEYDIMSDITIMHREQTPTMAKKHQWLTKPLSIDFHFNRLECLRLAHDAKLRKQPFIEYKARTLYAAFVTLERVAPSPTSNVQQIISDATQELYMAKEIRQRFSSIDDEDTRMTSALGDRSWVRHPISDKELAKIKTLAPEGSACGSWHYCTNMHLVSSRSAS